MSGQHYVLRADAPAEMQPAYKGPNGPVWGAKYGYGFRYTLATAEATCASIGKGGKIARLPTRSELIGLLQAMSVDQSQGSEQELHPGPTKNDSIFLFGNPTLNTSLPALPELIGISYPSIQYDGRYAPQKSYASIDMDSSKNFNSGVLQEIVVNSDVENTERAFRCVIDLD